MKRALRRVAIIAGTTVALLYVAWGAAVFSMQRKLLFPKPESARAVELKGSTLLRIPSLSGEVVAFHNPATAGQRTIVFFHGNAQQLGDLVTFARLYHSVGLGFFAVEYPGYGLAPGEPSEKSIEAAAQTALDYARDTLHLRNEALIIEGWSIGSGVAAEMALRGYGAKLALVSPYTSIVDLGRAVLPYHPARLLVRDPFDTEAKAPRIQQPTLIIHGARDDLIPVEMGLKLGQLFPHVQTEIIKDDGHDISMRGDVISRIATFAVQP